VLHDLRRGLAPKAGGTKAAEPISVPAAGLSVRDIENLNVRLFRKVVKTVGSTAVGGH
jgi:hypothetical protein